MIPETVTQDELGIFLDLSKRRIEQLVADGTFPKKSYRELDFKGCIKGLRGRQKEKTAPAVERLNLAKAKREERKDRQESGDDVSVPVVNRAWAEIGVTTTQRVMRIGNNVQSKIGLTEPQRKAIDDEARAALTELGKQVNLAADIGDEQGDEAAIEALKAK